MPKKGKGKGKAEKGPSKDDQIAELQQQIAALKLEISEETKIRERLERENLNKIQQIGSIEDLIRSTREKHSEEVEILDSEALTEKCSKEYTITMLENKVRTLERHLEAYNVMERENMSLRSRVTSLLTQVEKEGMDHAHETHSMKKEMFNLRMQLEQTFRKTLQELDGQYQKKAFDAMSEESKNALMANAKLKEELALQSVGVENLLQRYKRQDLDLGKHRVDQDILQNSNSIQLNNIAGLKRHKYEQEARFSDMQLALHGLKTRLQTKEHECSEFETVQDELSQCKQINEKSRIRAEKWKQRERLTSQKYKELQEQYDEMIRMQQREQISLSGQVDGNQNQENTAHSRQSGSMLASLKPDAAALTLSLGASGYTTKSQEVKGPVLSDPSAIWSSQFPCESVKRTKKHSKSRKLKPSASLPASLHENQAEASVIRKFPQALSTEKRWEREARFFVPS